VVRERNPPKWEPRSASGVPPPSRGRGTTRRSGLRSVQVGVRNDVRAETRTPLAHHVTPQRRESHHRDFLEPGTEVSAAELSSPEGVVGLLNLCDIRRHTEVNRRIEVKLAPSPATNRTPRPVVSHDAFPVPRGVPSSRLPSCRAPVPAHIDTSRDASALQTWDPTDFRALLHRRVCSARSLCPAHLRSVLPWALIPLQGPSVHPLPQTHPPLKRLGVTA